MKKIILLALFLASNFITIHTINAYKPKHHSYSKIKCSFIEQCDHLASSIGYGYLSYLSWQFASDLQKNNYLLTDVAALVATIFALDFGLYSVVHLAQVSSSD